MKFKTAKQGHAYCDVMNKLKIDVRAEFWRHQKKLRDSNPNTALWALRDELIRLENSVAKTISDGLERFRKEWDTE